MATASVRALLEGLERAHWGTVELWRAALGTGGSFSRGDIDEILAGRLVPTSHEHDVLASALNDHFVGRGEDHPVSYWRELSNGDGVA